MEVSPPGLMSDVARQSFDWLSISVHSLIRVNWEFVLVHMMNSSFASDGYGYNCVVVHHKDMRL